MRVRKGPHLDLVDLSHQKVICLVEAGSLTKSNANIHCLRFAPRTSERSHCGLGETSEVVFYVYGFPDPDITWTFRGHELDTTSAESRHKVTDSEAEALALA